MHNLFHALQRQDTSRTLKKSTFTPTQPQRVNTRFAPSFVLAALFEDVTRDA
jgi:hypothetical protein